MTEARVRPARLEDADQVAVLWDEMYCQQRSSGMQLPMRADAVSIWRRQLTADRLDSAVSVILVAELSPAETTISGFLAAQIKRLPAHLITSKSKVGFVSEIYVSPSARRHRVGRSLVDAALRWFDRAEVGSVELQVLVDNAEARDFWSSIGFATELVQMRLRRD